MNYESKKWEGPFYLENMYTSELGFRPSSLVELHYSTFSEELDDFRIYLLNDFKMVNLPNHPSGMRRDPILGSDYFNKIRTSYDEPLLI